jgi:polyisoprenoid-binding protein YceI
MRAGHPRCGAGWLARPEEMPVTTMTPYIYIAPGGQPRLAPGSWRVNPADSQASFTAHAVGHRVRGSLPLTGRVLVAEPMEDSTALLAARTTAVSTGSPFLDRLLAGPGFLDAGAFPEISFRSELLAWVPAGWRALGGLKVKNTEHELACQLDLHVDEMRPGGLPRITIASSWVIDSRWITTMPVLGLGRQVLMACSFRLEPQM